MIYNLLASQSSFMGNQSKLLSQQKSFPSSAQSYACLYEQENKHLAIAAAAAAEQNNEIMHGLS